MTGLWRWLWVAVVAALTACGPDQYPKDWPKPASSWFDRRGGCPDLTGDYDNVDANLGFLLGANPDFERSTPFWFPHHARVTQDDDGRWLRIDFELNEKGLVAWRDHMLRYNLSDTFEKRANGPLELNVGEDYTCSGGWYRSVQFAQAQPEHGWQRKSLQMAKREDGALIVGYTIRKEQSVGWGDSRGIPLGSVDDTAWRYWPARKAADEVGLRKAQRIELRRYPWINDGRDVPTRLSSFYLEPICMRFRQYGTWQAPYIGELRRSERDPPTDDGCPDGWTRVQFGTTIRRPLAIWSADAGTPDPGYRYEWFAQSLPAEVHTIDVPDPRELPMMPKDD